MAIKFGEAKDPLDISWWKVDASSFLDGSTIATATFTVPAGITKLAQTNSSTYALVKLSGGTAGASYTLGLTITTNDTQTFQRDVVLTIKNQ